MTQTTEPLRRLCQSILKDNDSNDSVAATTDELLSRVAKTALNAFDTSTTYHVAAGESVQAAITKAVAKYAETSVRCAVKLGAGDYTLTAQIVIPTGVDVEPDGAIQSARIIAPDELALAYPIKITGNGSVCGISVINQNTISTGCGCINVSAASADSANARITDNYLECSEWCVCIDGSHNADFITILRNNLNGANPIYISGISSSFVTIANNFSNYVGTGTACHSLVDMYDAPATYRWSICNNIIVSRRTGGAFGTYMLRLSGAGHTISGNQLRMINDCAPIGAELTPLLVNYKMQSDYVPPTGITETSPILITNNTFVFEHYHATPLPSLTAINLLNDSISNMPNLEFENNIWDIKAAITSFCGFTTQGTLMSPRVKIIIRKDGVRGLERVLPNLVAAGGGMAVNPTAAEIPESDSCVELIGWPTGSGAGLTHALMDKCFGDHTLNPQGVLFIYKNTADSNKEYLVWTDATNWKYSAVGASL